MAKQTTPIRYDMKPGEVKPFSFDYMREKGLRVTSKDLAAFGISMDSAVMRDMRSIYSNAYAMDAAAPLQTTPTITNPVQFFQYWAPEAVEYVTQARTIDEIVGRTIAGSFEDEEIVTTALERTGKAQPYTDTANIPLASWNQNFVTRSIVRFEEGLEVGYLEAMRASRMRVDTQGQKKEAVAESLAIEHNNVGFYGYSNGQNKTYGLLNDPNLTPYRTVAEGAKSLTSWASKTFLEITADIITAVGQLQTQLRGHFNPIRDTFTMSLSLASMQYLNTMNELGTKSVSTWIKETYPNVRIVASPEMDGANGGSNVFYLHADKIGRVDTIKQYVQDVLRLVGMEKKAKVILEDYASATAGIIVQQPLGIVRYSGI